MIVILEDDPERIKHFRSWMPNAKIVGQASQAIALLKERNGAEFLCLDHDLDGRVYVDSLEPNTGMAVVRWIVENRPVIEHIFIHTHNDTAGKEMARVLKVAGYSVEYEPFFMILLNNQRMMNQLQRRLNK